MSHPGHDAMAHSWQPLPDHPPLPVLDDRTPEEICGYGDDGLCDHGTTP